MLNSVAACQTQKTENANFFLNTMTYAMKRRGRTGTDVKVNGVTLANAVFDSTGEYCVSFDGKLYGSNEPAKTLLEAYKEHGEKCLNLVDGCFAFCLYDTKKQRFFAARDRYGTRPLYYLYSDGLLALSSQIDALLTLGKHQPNIKLIRDYLARGWFCDIGETFFQGINEVLPGHYMLHTREKSLITQNFCQYPKLHLTNQRKNMTSVTEFLNIFKSTLKRMTPPTGKYGTSVSGGLDSTLIASVLCSNDKSRRHNMFSVICEGAAEIEAEAPYIAEFERFIDKEISYINLPLPPSWSDLQKFVKVASEPTPLLTYFISWAVGRRAKSEGIEVIFTGIGADTFLSSMPHKQREYIRYLWNSRRIPVFVREALGLVVQNGVSYNKIKRLLREVQKEVRHKPSMDLDASHLLNQRFFKENSESTESPYTMIDVTFIGAINQNMKFLDRAYASEGVEPVHPFLDKTLSEYMANLPMDMKIKYGIRKYLLNHSSKGLVPEVIRKSKHKFPSSIPLAKWLIGWESQITELLDSEEFKSRGFYNSKRVKVEYEKLRRTINNTIEANDIAFRVWRVINVELWYRQYFT